MSFWRNKSVPPEIADAISQCREYLWFAAALSALVNILYLAPTIYMMQIYDRIVPTGGILTLFWITLIVGFALGTLALLDAIRSKIMVRASLRLERLLASQIFDRLLARRRTNGDEASNVQAMRDFDALRAAVGGNLALVVFDIPWTPIYVIVAFIIHGLLAMLIICGGVLLIFITFLNEKHTREQQMKGLRAVANSYSQQENMASHAEMVGALGMRRAIVSRQLGERSNGLLDSSEAQMRAGNYIAIAKFLRMFLQSLALGLGAWLAIERQISVGAIIAASVLLSRALQPIEQLVAMLPSINHAKNALTNLSALFEAKYVQPSERTQLPKPKGDLSIEGVSVLAGVDRTIILNGVSFSAGAGQVLGVIGPTGAGKSTLARVICGGLSPDHGTVRIDGANMLDWDPEQLARHVGYMPQHCVLLPGTITENISRFSSSTGLDRGSLDERVIDAAKAAGVHDMILSMPGGYDRTVDGQGSGVSIGQQQRVGLARALFDDPALLVLDEPNSALDADGESALASAISAARERGAMVFLIAHRSGILALADQLLLLNKGSVERLGPRDKIINELKPKTQPSNVFGMKGG